MKYKLYIILLIASLSYICSSFKLMNESEKFVSILNSEVFKTYFKICENKSDTIKIYNNQNEFLDSQSFKIDCEKTILVEKSNLKIDVNSTIINRENKIVLYKIKKIKSQYHFSFIDINSNSALTLSINNKNKITIISKGAF